MTPPEVSTRKRLIGPRVRRLREQQGWTQKQLADRLALSLSYVSQIENNQRPATAGVELKLGEIFGHDFLRLSHEDDRRRLAELDAALRDRTLLATPLPPATLSRMIDQSPELVEAFLALLQRHTRLQEEHAQALDRLHGDSDPRSADSQSAASAASAANAASGVGGAPGAARAADDRQSPARLVPSPMPPEAVRDYLNRRDNYLDALDRLAEAMAGDNALMPGQRSLTLARRLAEDAGLQVRLVSDDEAEGRLRQLDRSRHCLDIPASLSDAQQAFQIATQYALEVHAGPINAEVRDSGFVDPATVALARQGLAHYFAGALVLPYRRFLAEAQASRYDIELLQRRFHVGFETVCHRLSTLQRPGERGVPFYFVRLDQAGNISKRQSASAFHFARYGGACPLWHVHEAFAQPERILTQVVEMPDGSRFFGIARTTSRGGGGFRSRRKAFAVGLGCELSRAADLVYADGIDPAAPRDVVPIGPGCRVCPRGDCVQRAFPPAGKALLADTDVESLVPFRHVGD